MRLIHSVLVLSMTLTVSACSSLPDLGGGARAKKEAATAEEKAGRITMVLDENSLEPNPDLASKPIELPPAEALAGWPQAGANAQKVTGHVAAASAMQVAWRRQVGKGSSLKSALTTPPVASDRLIYTLDASQTVRANDVATGAPVWSKALKGVSKRDRHSLGGGLALEGNTLIVASGYSHVTSMNAETGAVNWQRPLGAPMTGAPTVKEGRIFVASHNNELFALDFETGETLWSDQAIAESARVLSSPSPATAEDFVVAPYSSGEVIAYRSDNGRRLWVDAITQAGRFTPISEINDIGSRPVLAGGLVFASSQSGTTVAIDGRSGKRIWQKGIGSAQAPALVGRTLFVVGNDARIAALDAATGDVFWVKQLPQYGKPKARKDRISYSAPIIASDRILVASSRGELLAFSPQTGEAGGALKLGGKVFLEPVSVGDKVFILTDDAKLVAIR